MKKKLIIGMLCVTVSIGVVACKDKEVETMNITQTEETQVVTEEPEPNKTEQDKTQVVAAEEPKVEEEVSSEVIEEEPVAVNEFNVTAIDPIAKYTNTGSNIRITPSKDGDLVDTVVINTELTVTGTTEDEWSRVEHNGLVCYIKSSLLSDSRTEIKTTTKSAGSKSSGDSSSSSPTTASGAPVSSGDSSGGDNGGLDLSGLGGGSVPVVDQGSNDASVDDSLAGIIFE